MKNLYRILGVHRGSTVDEMREARKKLAFANHPDRGGSPQKMFEINEAYRILSHLAAKKRYNVELSTAGYQCGTCEGEGFLVLRKGYQVVGHEPCGTCFGAGVVINEVL